MWTRVRLGIKREPNSIPRPFFPLLYYPQKALNPLAKQQLEQNFRPRLASLLGSNLLTSSSFHKQPPHAFQASLPLHHHACHDACPLSSYHSPSFRTRQSTSQSLFLSSIPLHSRWHLVATARLERQHISRPFFDIWQLRWQHRGRLGEFEWWRLWHRPG